MSQTALAIPSPEPDDNEDVVSALEMAELFFMKGEIDDCIRWVKRAAETASDVGQDVRALKFARLAADLKSRVVPPVSGAMPAVAPAPASAVVQARPTPPPLPAAAPISSRGAPNASPEAARREEGRPSTPPAPIAARVSRPPPPPSARSSLDELIVEKPAARAAAAAAVPTAAASAVTPARPTKTEAPAAVPAELLAASMQERLHVAHSAVSAAQCVWLLPGNSPNEQRVVTRFAGEAPPPGAKPAVLLLG